ncbi:MAG: MFS transporter [Clostridium sp.]|uniref:MFS transporter n=1 Tax=Clostridium innocuum TaxID=1522 RepID=UPI001E3E17D5|nr:MFS transporter [[Clostridium] innocuum]MCR0390750.1 MFS transporter [[Clostridium] innocuum]
MITITKQMRWLLYAMNFLAFFAISMVNTQMIPFLSKLGYTVVQRGYILAANAVVAIVGQFLFGYLCDRFQRVKVFFLAAYLLLTASSFAMFLVEHQTFWYHLFTVALMGGMVKVIMGLDETWMLEVDQENYGRLRASGALGLTIGSPIAGFLVHRFHYTSILISLGIVSVILCWLIIKAKDADKKKGERIKMESVQQLLKNRGYLLLVFIYLLVYMIGTADQYVVIDKMLDIGGNSTAVGIKWALQSFMEVPLFLFSAKILARFQTKTLLYFGTLMYGIKFLLYGISFQPWMIILTAALQLVTLPIIMLTSKVLIKEITPEKLFSSAQMFAMAVFIGVSGLITPLITSYLSKAFGYDWTLYIVAAFSIIPLLLIFYYVHHFQKQKTEKKAG